MICPQCGYDMDESFMCPKCGYQAKEMKPLKPEIKVKNPPFGILMFFSILEFFLFGPAGIIAIVFTVIMKQRFEVGAYDESDQYKKYAIRTLIIGFVLFVAAVLLFIFVFVGTYVGAMSKVRELVENTFDVTSANIDDMFVGTPTNPLDNPFL